MQSYKTEVLGVFSIVNRSTKKLDFNVNTFSLLNLEAPLYKESELPESLSNTISISARLLTSRSN